MMSTMDPKVADLLNAVRPQGKKRKLEATHDSITASDVDSLLADFNTLQGNGALTSGNQQLFSNGIQPTAASSIKRSDRNVVAFFNGVIEMWLRFSME